MAFNPVAKTFEEQLRHSLKRKFVVVLSHFPAYLGHIARENIMGAVDESEIVA